MRLFAWPRFRHRFHFAPKTPQVRFSPRFAVPAQQRPSPPNDLAEAVVKKALMAYGGEAKILSFKNATFQYQVESMEASPAKPVQMKAYFKESSYFRSEASGEGTDAVTILNRDKGWVKVGDTTLSLSQKSVDPLKSAIIAQLRPDLLLVSFSEVPLRRQGRGRRKEIGSRRSIGISFGRICARTTVIRLEHPSDLQVRVRDRARSSQRKRDCCRGRKICPLHGDQMASRFRPKLSSRQGRKTSRLTIRQVSFVDVLDAALFQDPTPAAAPLTPAPKP